MMMVAYLDDKVLYPSALYPRPADCYYNYDSETEDMESSCTTIYPCSEDYIVPLADLKEYCEKAIERYNDYYNEGNPYAFVELVEAFKHYCIDDYILIYFKACQSDGTNITSFRADIDIYTYLSPPKLDIRIQVVPAHSPDDQADKLGTRVDGLQISSSL